MAVSIGPKIGLEGEAEYRKSLQNVIQQQKTLAAEMKETTSAFDKNATAQDKARAKAENLSKQIDAQKTRVEKLKDMVEKSAEKYGEADTRTLKWKEALANANTELNQMEAELQKVNAEINPSVWENISSAINSAGEKMKAFGEKAKSVGDNMTKYVTAPITAAAAAAVASFKNLDSGYDTIIKKTGATGDAYEDLKEQANDLYTTMNVSLDDIGAAIGEVNTRFGLTGDAAEDTARQFLEFAKVNDTDVSSSIDTVQNALAAFNMDADDAGNLLDVLTATAQKTGASTDKMASIVVQNATAFQQMGLDIYQAVDFMGQFETAGADSESVLSGMKRALKSATEAGIPFDQALADLEDTIVNGTDDMDGLSAAYDLFGKSGAAVYEAVKNGQISFTDFASSADVLNEALGRTDETYNATLDPMDEFGIALNNAKVAGAEIGTTLLKMAVPAIKKVTDVVKKVAAWWNNLDESHKKTIVTVAAVVAAIGPIVSVIGAITTAVDVLSVAISPIGLIIAAIVAAVAAVIIIIKNWGAITEWFKGVWESATSWVSEKVQAMKDAISGAWENIKSKTSEAWSNIKAKVQENGGGIKGILTTAAQGYKQVWTNAFNTIDSITGGKLSEAYAKVQSKMEAIKSSFTTKLEAAKTAVKNAIDKIKSFFNFSWSLPKLKMPHFTITGEFSLKPPSVPKISVEWYKKAYGQPMMFNSPTVLATSSGLKGFGDGSGGEIVIGQSMMYSMIRGAVSDAMGDTYNNDINIVVNAAPGQDAEEIANIVSEKINEAVYARRAVFA